MILYTEMEMIFIFIFGGVLGFIGGTITIGTIVYFIVQWGNKVRKKQNGEIVDCAVTTVEHSRF